jgi:hypothetical protein
MTMVERAMTLTSSSSIRMLSDGDLLAEVTRAAANERQATAHLLAVLMELDTRRLYLGEGFSSLFTYCTQALHLSEHAAYNRIEAARAARRFPLILDLIQDGAITLTAVRLLAPHLTIENYRNVLASARHKNKREVELLVAGLHPQPDLPPVVRKLPTRVGVPLGTTTPGMCPPMLEATHPATTYPSQVAALRETKPAELKPIAPERFKIQFTASRETYEKLRHAQALLRHVLPDGDPARVVDRALTLLIAELERAKTAATDRPRASRADGCDTRHIPAHVKRAVWQRDGGRCAFVGTMGRCSETGFLEYHHVVPFSAGGTATTSNISLRCRAHNVHEAKMYFGSTQPLPVPEDIR